MMVKELIEHLTFNLEYATKYNELDNPADWNMQEGVLLDYKEAQYVLELLKKQQEEKYSQQEENEFKAHLGR